MGGAREVGELWSNTGGNLDEEATSFDISIGQLAGENLVGCHAVADDGCEESLGRSPAIARDENANGVGTVLL